MGGGIIKCLEHGTVTYAGVCSRCVPDTERQLDHSRGPDPDSVAIKKYLQGYDGEESSVMENQPLNQCPDPYEET